jgi:hypothetical protein
VSSRAHLLRSSRRLALAALLALGCASNAPQAASAADSPDARPPHPQRGAAASRRLFQPDEALFLSAIPLRVSEGVKDLIVASKTDTEFASALRVRLAVMRSYKDLGELSRRAKLPVINGTFQISDLSHLGSRDTPTKHDQASSFLIDYGEASFSAPVAELERSGQAGSPDAIASFAGRYISEKTYSHSFDIASRVATSHAGDCTEHAVFTAALLRRFGFKARVVLGIVLVGVAAPGNEPRLSAFGHAWVERYGGGQWQIVDAALGHGDGPSDPARPTVTAPPAEASVRLVYLPINLLKDESPSYARALMNEVGTESVTGLEVEPRSGP